MRLLVTQLEKEKFVVSDRPQNAKANATADAEIKARSESKAIAKANTSATRPRQGERDCPPR